MEIHASLMSIASATKRIGYPASVKQALLEVVTDLKPTARQLGFILEIILDKKIKDKDLEIQVQITKS